MRPVGPAASTPQFQLRIDRLDERALLSGSALTPAAPAWFNQNLNDPGIRGAASALYVIDGQLTYADTIAVLDEAAPDGDDRQRAATRSS